MDVSVATIDGALAGFVALDLRGAPTMAEIHMIAVDPAHQRRGVAEALMSFAEQSAAARGVRVLMVETGGDEGHAPARSLYSSSGYRNVSVARFFKRIG